MKEQFEAGGAPVNVEKSALLMLWGLFKRWSSQTVRFRWFPPCFRKTRANGAAR